MYKVIISKPVIKFLKKQNMNKRESVLSIFEDLSIDYQITSPDLASKVISATVYKENWFSDHAPLIMEYDFEIE